MTTTTEHLNSPVRNCQTCAHCSTTNLHGLLFHDCARFGGVPCMAAAGMPEACGPSLSAWGAKPPIPPPPVPRSLRQWFYDTFWKIDTNDLP